MKTLKSVLGVLVALCLMMCLAVPAFATDTTTEAATGDATTEATTGDATTEATTGDTTADSEDTVADGADDVIDESGESIVEDETTTETTEDSTTGTEDKSSVLRTVLLILEVIASIALIVVVLLQSGKESGLGNTISGNSDSYMSKNKKGGLDRALASATKWVALAWIIITLALGFV